VTNDICRSAVPAPTRSTAFPHHYAYTPAYNASSVGNVAAMQGGSQELNKALEIPSSPLSSPTLSFLIPFPLQVGPSPDSGYEVWGSPAAKRICALKNASTDNIFGSFM